MLLVYFEPICDHFKNLMIVQNHLPQVNLDNWLIINAIIAIAIVVIIIPIKFFLVNLLIFKANLPIISSVPIR